MKEKKSKKIILNFALSFCILIFAFLNFNAREARAATTVYFDSGSPAIYEGDTFVVSFKISTPEEDINVIDGTILYDGGRLEIKEVSTGGSIFSLWPKLPASLNDKGRLGFVGGAPGGFKGESGEIFKIIFLAKNTGETKIDFLDVFSVFLNDGEGTRIHPLLRPLALEVLTRPPGTSATDEWQDLLMKDRTSPEFVEAIISRDPRVFDDKYFVSFFATDDGTGVSHYEIKEGGRGFVKIESPYLLKDQSLKEAVQIKVVDKAGNESVITPELAPVPGIPYKTYLIWGIIALIIVAVIFWLWRRRFLKL